MLAQAQGAHSHRIRCVAGKVKPAEPLDGRDATCAQSGGESRNWFRGVNGLAIGTDQLQAGPAGRARCGLRVEAAIGRIAVLTMTILAHGEVGHCGIGTVVGRAANDRQSRAAVGAVQERISVPPISGITHLANTIGTGRRIRRDEDCC